MRLDGVALLDSPKFNRVDIYHKFDLCSSVFLFQCLNGFANPLSKTSVTHPFYEDSVLIAILWPSLVD